MTILLFAFGILLIIGFLQSVRWEALLLVVLLVVAGGFVISLLPEPTPEQQAQSQATIQRNYAEFLVTAEFDSHCQWQWLSERDGWRCVDWQDVDWAAQGVQHP